MLGGVQFNPYLIVKIPSKKFGGWNLTREKKISVLDRPTPLKLHPRKFLLHDVKRFVSRPLVEWNFNFLWEIWLMVINYVLNIIYMYSLIGKKIILASFKRPELIGLSTTYMTRSFLCLHCSPLLASCSELGKILS